MPETKKYELTDERHPNDPSLRRIRALTDTAQGVRAGDLGGYVSSELNLSQSGDAWVYGNARVSGNARVHGDARVSGNARVYGDAEVSGDAWVSGDARVYGNAWVYGDARVYGNAEVYLPAHCLTVAGLPSGTATLTPDTDGMPLLRVGCWSGTPDNLRTLVAGTAWPAARGDEQDARRPALAALADLADAVAASWNKEADES